MQVPVTRWLTISEFLEEYEGRISRNRLYQFVKDQAIPYVRPGIILVPSDLFERIMNQQQLEDGK